MPGNGIAAVSATSVTRILPPGKPTLTLAAKDQSIDATVVFTAHGTSDITKYQYRTKTTGSYGSWTDSTENVSNTGGTFTIGGLTNGTEYTVQARGVNSDGEGAESDAKAATPDAPPAVSSIAITSDPGHRQDLHHRRRHRRDVDVRQEHHIERRRHFAPHPYISISGSTSETQEANCVVHDWDPHEGPSSAPVHVVAG